MVANFNSFKRLSLSLMVVILCLFSNKVSASHVAAADLYVDYIGSGPNDFKYRITLVLFKACEPNNAGLTTSETVYWTSSCMGAGACGQRTLPMVQGPDTLDQLCDTFKSQNSCRIPSSIFPGFERRIYSDTITLAMACNDWRFWWSLCCRNNAIANYTGASGASMYIEAGLNNAAKWNNSTPRFLINPIPYLCKEQPAFFLNGPFDPNNDSLVSLNMQANTVAGGGCTATGQIIQFQSPFVLSNPLPSSTPYLVNPNTATASFTPTTIGKYVLAFRCNEYDRNSGTLLGYITRDVQLSVLNCNAPPPSIDSVPTQLTNTYLASTTAGDKYLIATPDCPMTFKVKGQSNSVSNKLYMSANNGMVIPTSNFTVTGQGTSSPQGTFTWTPTAANIGDYTLIITVKDSTCNNTQPIVLPNFLVVFIKVVQPVNAGPDGRICVLDGIPWQFNVTGPNNVPYTWTSVTGGAPIGLSNPNVKNPTAYPPYNFTYVVSTPAIPIGCKGSDTVTVFIDTSNSVKATPKNFVQCRPGYVQLNAEGIGNPPLVNLECGITNTLPPCATPDTATVQSQLQGTTLINTNVNTPFPAYRTAKIQILLTKKDLFDYGMKPGTIRGLAFRVTTPTGTQYNNFKMSMKCTDRAKINAQTGSFEQGMIQVYSAPSAVSVTSGWNWFVLDNPYNWDSTKNLIIEICYSNTGTGGPATVGALTTASEQMAMSWANAGTANICANPSIALGTVYYSIRPEVRLNFCKAPYDNFHFVWKPSLYLSDTTASNPYIYLNKSTKVHVYTVGGNGCKVQDSVFIKVPIHTFKIWPADTTFCAGESFKTIVSGNFATVKWFEDKTLSLTNPVFQNPTSLNCTNCTAPIGKPSVSTNYYAVLTDADGCSDTLMMKAIVKPLPNVKIVNNDTTIKYGQSVQLLVSGAYLYSWQPMSSLTNPNIVNPVASPSEPTTYIVYGVHENGCRNLDSVHVNIDYRDNLFVPSAFTPNGDGKNDVFKVTNITFQRLLEFRVFNRWGQEIYSTNDPKKGWDGTWKGVPQDMGVYEYLIRVAYPDGFVETYKGDITLVR